MISPAITAIAILIYTAIAFGSGFLISDWRSGAKIASLEGDKTVLSTANDDCAADVANAKTAMDLLERSTNELERQAAKAVKEAAPKVAERTRIIKEIKAQPKVAPDQQCEAIIKEQIEYVQTRK